MALARISPYKNREHGTVRSHPIPKTRYNQVDDATNAEYLLFEGFGETEETINSLDDKLK